MDLNLVWIEIGRKLPRYAKRNFKLTNEICPKIAQTLVSDTDYRNDFLETVSSIHLPKSAITREFLEIKRQSLNHQDYFWIGTTARFFYLYDYMTASGIKHAIHAETDVVLLDEQSIKMQYEKRFGISYPLQNLETGVASIFLVNEIGALRDFLEFILENWERQDINDMTLLGEFSTSKGVHVLPTSIQDAKESKENTIFDAATLGPFFTGIDARNKRIPFRSRGILSIEPFASTKLLTEKSLKWSLMDQDRSVNLTLESEQGSFRVANLHFHSKNISSNINDLKRDIRKSFLRKRNLLWKLGSLDFTVLLERCISYVARRAKASNPDRNLR